MSSNEGLTVRDLLLTRRGVVVVPPGSGPAPEDHVRGVELELAELGYVLSSRLRERLGSCSSAQLAAVCSWAVAALLAQVGGDREHEPLFRRFPEGVPKDTLALWWKKVLVHFVQAEGQPCLFCRRTGTTHVLEPCCHVVCSHCFDGRSYSACPCCEHHVDRSSPFFQEAPTRERPNEKVLFKLLDLAESAEDEARALFASLCERKQALSPDDREALRAILREHSTQVLEWLPSKIPLKENVAIVFGTLLQDCPPAEVLPQARRHLATATDVLRLIAVYSGTDGSLLRETVFRKIDKLEPAGRFWGRIAELLGASPPGPSVQTATIPLRICRFKVAKLSRSLRRTLLSLLDGLDPDRLVEDMLRHRSYWVWVGQFLHPHEYETRYPNAARAFWVVRKKSPTGAPAPRFESWYSRLEQTIRGGDADAMLTHLAERPGEFARRFDHVLRMAGDDTAVVDRVVATFLAQVMAFATPVLLTLRSHLPTRTAKASVRIYWPKGRIAKGVSTADERATLPLRAIEPTVRAIDAELLRRFAAKPHFEACWIDEALRTVMVPFNERTASSSAISLPRGSRISVPTGKLIRLFLHWCQPAQNGHTTDLDLSVGLYDDSWQYVGVCSYYQLEAAGKDGTVIARSAGDLRDAPWPDGATELVDLHLDEALATGVRYAVMVVNSYRGMPFSQLERGFAGLMLRNDPGGQHFDPRTVELRFALDGENGIFIPLVLDVSESVLHWLDVQAKGDFEMNNVETSDAAITQICPDVMAYFASGVRTSMFDLVLLHAAARCECVYVRGPSGAGAQYARREGEEPQEFLARMVRGEADEPRSQAPGPDGPPLLAALCHGDVSLPEGSEVYALFREELTPTMAASDLLS